MYIRVYSSELHEVRPVVGFECEAASQVSLELRRQGLDQRSIHCLLPLNVLLWELLHRAQCVVRDLLCSLAGLCYKCCNSDCAHVLKSHNEFRLHMSSGCKGKRLHLMWYAQQPNAAYTSSLQAIYDSPHVPNSQHYHFSCMLSISGSDLLLLSFSLAFFP